MHSFYIFVVVRNPSSSKNYIRKRCYLCWPWSLFTHSMNQHTRTCTHNQIMDIITVATDRVCQHRSLILSSFAIKIANEAALKHAYNNKNNKYTSIIWNEYGLFILYFCGGTQTMQPPTVSSQMDLWMMTKCCVEYALIYICHMHADYINQKMTHRVIHNKLYVKSLTMTWTLDRGWNWFGRKTFISYFSLENSLFIS